MVSLLSTFGDGQTSGGQQRLLFCYIVPLSGLLNTTIGKTLTCMLRTLMSESVESSLNLLLLGSNYVGDFLFFISCYLVFTTV